jgi:hypothetical protein
MTVSVSCRPPIPRPFFRVRAAPIDGPVIKGVADTDGSVRHSPCPLVVWTINFVIRTIDWAVPHVVKEGAMAVSFRLEISAAKVAELMPASTG